VDTEKVIEKLKQKSKPEAEKSGGMDMSSVIAKLQQKDAANKTPPKTAEVTQTVSAEPMGFGSFMPMSLEEMSRMQDVIGKIDVESTGRSLQDLEEVYNAVNHHRPLTKERQTRLAASTRKHSEYLQLELQLIQHAEVKRLADYYKLASAIAAKAYRPENMALMAGKELFDVLEGMERTIDRSRKFVLESIKPEESTATLLEELNDEEVKEMSKAVGVLRKIPPQRREKLRQLINMALEGKKHSDISDKSDSQLAE